MGLPVVRMGDLIWEEVSRQGLPRDAQHVGQVANAMRQSHGPDVWSRRTVERVRQVAREQDIDLERWISALEDAMASAAKKQHRIKEPVRAHLDRESGKFEAFIVKKVVETATLCHAHLGVLRRSVMEQTALIGNEVASDLRFLAEMSLYGKFYVLPEYLFHRRFHEASSSWDRQSSDWQRQYYDPSHRSLFGLHTWRRYFHLGLAVARAPLTGADKWSLLNYVARKARWQRRKLWAELKSLGHIRT